MGSTHEWKGSDGSVPQVRAWSVTKANAGVSLYWLRNGAWASWTVVLMIGFA
jgi:hypothetical protein